MFLFKYLVSEAISSNRDGETKKLMRRFLTVLDAVAVNEIHKHIASHYAKLLRGLWFHCTETGYRQPVKEKADQQFHHTGVNASTCADVSTNLACGPLPCMELDVNGDGHSKGLSLKV